MGKKKEEGKDEEGEKMEKEGRNLLGQPKFKKLENGRLKCVETGHELPAHSKESYARSKHCRLGLIDAALAGSKPPLNMFHQDPLSRSKLICKLTGVTINKSEDHIWKHINGRRFLNMLEKKEDERQMKGEMLAEQGQQTQERMSRTKAKGLKKKKKEDKNAIKDISEVRNSSNMDSSSEGDDFWMPPVGNRWDFDEGGDRWDSSLESESETEPAKEEEKMEILRLTVAWSLLVCLVLRMGIKEVMAIEADDIPAIYNFGDSNSDTGGIAAAFFPMAAPCGETFFHRPAGRGSDGRLIIDFIAERLKLPYLSPYLDSIGTNFSHGANFATGGATIRRQNESWFENGVSPFPLDIQVEHFIQFKARGTYFYNQANEASQRSRLPRPEDFSRALYTFDIGQNDLADGFRKLTAEQLRAAIPDIINQLAAAVQQLYKEGARAFWIHNTGPIGCLPVAVVDIHNATPGYLDEQGCIKSQNDMAMEFNKQLKDRVIRLREELPQAALIYVDLYAAKYGLISTAKRLGFEDPFKICCGQHENGMHVWCGNKANIEGTEVYAGSCANPSTVVSWDGVHYSESANFWVASQIMNGSMSDPPVPITKAYYKHI